MTVDTTITPANLERWTRESIIEAKTITNPQDRDAISWDGRINKKSVVFEVGSYRGRWAYQMAIRYNPKLYCFEPQPWAAAVTAEVLKGYRAQVFNFALGTETREAILSHHGNDSATMIGRWPNSIKINVIAIDEFLKEHNPDGRIDLMLMNIEGYEHDLIPYMFKKKILPGILMVQMHGPYQKNRQLRELIDSTYKTELFNYGSVLTAWSL